MQFAQLTDDNLIIYAIKAYDKPNFVSEDFAEDFKRIQYLQKLFYRYTEHGELKERLILNHLIILNNVFGTEPNSRILFFKIPETYYPILKTFMLFLNILPKRIEGVKDHVIHTDDILLDMRVATALRQI